MRDEASQIGSAFCEAIWHDQALAVDPAMELVEELLMSGHQMTSGDDWLTGPITESED